MAVPSLSVIRHGCLLHSLTRADLRLQLLSNGQWRDMVSSPRNVPMYALRVRVNKISRGLIFVGVL